MFLFNKSISFFNRITWKSNLKRFKKVGSNNLCQKGFSIKGHKYISMGDFFRGGDNIVIHAWDSYKGVKNKKNPELIIGSNVTMTRGSYISCSNKIKIGNGVLIGVNAFITDNLHGNNVDELNLPPGNRKLYSKGQVIIGDNVSIGRNVCVMPDVSIGEGTVIGANAVVTHDLPEYCIAAGVPAKPIRMLK